ncbi:MAG TPA: hypothetical protein VK772_18870, partial [Puia sp.]|nr:hypothetical protein [Puia sp.]
MKKSCLVLFICFSVIQICEAQQTNGKSIEILKDLPVQLRSYINNIDYSTLGNYIADVKYEVISDRIFKVSLTWIIKDSLQQDDWKIIIHPGFTPAFHWAPHLTPTENHIIAQHVFRSPALITASSQKQIEIVPDLDILKERQPVPWYMDMNATK